MFIGRRDEQARFAALLAELPVGRGWRRGQQQAAAGVSRVVLVHGLGGSGKSSLLRRFREIAEGRLSGSPGPPGHIRTAWLDWEDEQRDDPGSYGPAGPSLVAVLDALQRAVTRAFGTNEQATQAFADYRRGAARMPEYAARFADARAQNLAGGSPFTRDDAAALLGAAASAGLTMSGHPAGVLGLTPARVADVVLAGEHLSSAATRAVAGKKPGDISAAEYDLMTDPERELPRRTATAIRTAAGPRPLVVFLDTGEIIGEHAWAWLRRVMTLTGPRVMWVVGARFEIEAEVGGGNPVGLFSRDISDENLTLMTPARFDQQMIRAYLESRPGAPGYTDAQVNMITHFSKGLPLAVSLMAILIGQGQPVDSVCREMDDGQPGSVVSWLARRYLVHAEQSGYVAGDPRGDDVTKILALALAYGDLRDDPDLLAALWNVADPLAAFQDLARRYDFVLESSRRLHDDVRDTLRTDLLDPYRRARVRDISERAQVLYYARLEQMRGRWPTLDEQLGHSGFTSALLAMLWHTLWTDNQAGLDLLTRILPVLTAADPDTANAAVALTLEFADTFSQDQEHHFGLLTEEDTRAYVITAQIIAERAGGLPRRRRRRAKLTLPGLSLISSGRVGAESLVGEPGDQQGAVMILQAGLLAGQDDEAAVAAMRTAAALVGSPRLRQAIGSQAAAIAHRLIWAGPARSAAPTATGLAAAEIATQMLTGRASAWLDYAAALVAVGRPEDAAAAYYQSVILDPDRIHPKEGINLALLGDLDHALDELNIAEQLEPAGAGESRAWAGAILWHRGDTSGARDCFARVEGTVTGCTPFRSAEMEAVALCGLGRPDDAEQQLLSALPLRTPEDRADYRAIYGLLLDPPLPGIDRLRAILDNM
jgi:tetratricopeptide (TPR) repeat protein